MGWDETQAASLWPLGFFWAINTVVALLSHAAIRSTEKGHAHFT